MRPSTSTTNIMQILTTFLKKLLFRVILSSTANGYISTMRTQLAIVALGSNLEDRVAYLQEARCRLKKLFPFDFASSPLYITDPIGPAGQEPYLNQVVHFACSEEAQNLLHILKGIEFIMGRPLISERWNSRIIDLDLIALGDQVVESGSFHLPHLEVGNRPFVLQPLCDLLPQWSHPTEKWKAAERLKAMNPEMPGHILRRYEEAS